LIWNEAFNVINISLGGVLNAITGVNKKQIIVCCCPRVHKCWQKEDSGKEKDIDKYLNNIWH
jgi:hypothetical protein